MGTDGWLGVELRHLAALRAIAEEGSFGRAAVRLGYTQSAVSQQLATLERLVGVQLVERPGGPRPVRLTEAGVLLVRHAEGILARLRAAEADLASLAQGALSALRVGTFQSAGARILPETIRRFSGACADVPVSLTESEDEELLALVEAGELDLTFVALPLGEGPFAAVELMRDPYVLVVPADSPLARRSGAPTLRQIAALPLIGYKVCPGMRQVEAHMRAQGAEPRVVFRSEDNGTMQGLVAAGVGAALMPRLTVDEGDERIAVVPLEGRIPDRTIAVAWHRDRHRTEAAETFVEMARAVCAGIGEPPLAELAS